MRVNYDEKLAVCRDHGADGGSLRHRRSAGASARSRGARRETWSTTRSAARIRSRPSARSRGAAATGRADAAGEIPKLPLNLALGASVVGVFWGDFARREQASPRAWRSLRAGTTKAASNRTSTKRCRSRARARALKRMAERKVKGKLVLHLKIGSEPDFATGGGVPAAEMALHEHAVDPAAELEADRAQADAQKSAGCMHADGRAFALSPITAMIWR